MTPAIKQAADDLEAAEINMRSVLAREQKVCAHKRVIHSTWRSSEWGPAFKARRLCLDCGLEEQALHSGWGDNDHGFTFLKTNGFHKVVASDELYSARFPQAEIDANHPHQQCGEKT